MIARICFLVVLTSLIVFPSSTSAMKMCAQVIQYAQNSTKSECQAFPTPCDVPSGWSPVKECTLPLKEYKKPKFEVQKFASCEDMQKKVTTLLERYQSRYWYPYPMLYTRDGIV